MDLILGETVMLKGPGAPGPIPRVDLKVGDTFSPEGEEGTYKVITRSALYGQLGTGARILGGGDTWHYILRHGFTNFCFPVEPRNSPFGVPQDKGSGITWPNSDVSILAFDKVN